MLNTTAIESGVIPLTNEEFEDAIFGGNADFTRYLSNEFWDFFALYTCDMEVKTHLWAVVTRKPTTVLEPTWVMEFPYDNNFYGYALKEPITWTEWLLSKQYLDFDCFHVSTPTPEFQGHQAPLTVWHPEREYTFQEVVIAFDPSYED
jgi:hypothetical protein